MTAHTCTTFDPTCWRCDLASDEFARDELATDLHTCHEGCPCQPAKDHSDPTEGGRP